MRLGKKSETAKASPNEAVLPAREKPFIFVDAEGRPKEDGPRKLRHVSMDEVKIRPDELAPTPVRHGPATGRAMTDLEYLAQNATANELRLYRAATQARVARVVKVWRKCDNPTCGLVMESRSGLAEGTPCPNCNLVCHAAVVGTKIQPGHMRTMSEEEVREYKRQKAEADKRADERMFEAGFNARNAERGKAGLSLFTRDEYRKEREEEYRRMVGADRAAGQVWQPYADRTRDKE